MAGIYGTFASPADRSQPWWKRFSFPPIFALIAFFLSLGIVFCIWPISQIANALPGSQLTNLRRVLFAAHFAGAILAACTIDQILIKKNLKVAITAVLLCATGSLVEIDALCGQWAKFDRNWSDALQSVARQTPNLQPMMHSMIVQFAGYRILAGTIILIVGTLLLLCIVLLMIRRRIISPLTRYLLASIITIDVLLPAYDFTPITPMSIATTPEPPILTSMIQRSGDGRMLGVSGLNIGMHFGFRDIRGYDLPHDLRQIKLFRRLHLNDEFLTGQIEFNQLYPTIQPEISAYLDRACVRSVMLKCQDANIAPLMSSLKLEHAGNAPHEMDWPRVAEAPDRVMVFENPNSYPRTFLADNAEPATDAQSAMKTLLDSSIDLRKHSVFEGASTPRRLNSSEDESARSAKIVVDDPEKIVIDSQARSEHLLVLEDRMADGWRVTVDGNPAEALTANYLFRGVIVPAGHHSVEWTYHAPGLAAGVGVSIGTVVILIGLLAWPARRSCPC
jgi:hypothetical protein